MWLNELKIAVIKKDTDKLVTLIEELPKLKTAREVDSVLHLLDEAKSLVSVLRDDVETSMTQMKKNIHYLKSTQLTESNQLDIIS